MWLQLSFMGSYIAITVVAIRLRRGEQTTNTNETDLNKTNPGNEQERKARLIVLPPLVLGYEDLVTNSDHVNSNDKEEIDIVDNDETGHISGEVDKSYNYKRKLKRKIDQLRNMINKTRHHRYNGLNSYEMLDIL